jgi:hypothetical protein
MKKIPRVPEDKKTIKKDKTMFNQKQIDALELEIKKLAYIVDKQGHIINCLNGKHDWQSSARVHPLGSPILPTPPANHICVHCHREAEITLNFNIIESK